MKSGLRGKLKDFLQSPIRNQWLHGRHVSAYVRKGRHLGPDNKIHAYLDLASVEVEKEFWHKGIFSDLLKVCQELTPYDGVFLESVCNHGLQRHLRRKVEIDNQWHEKDYNFIWEKSTQTGVS
jgi:hypothetical protein